jgi:putative phage-type endonuclease
MENIIELSSYEEWLQCRASTVSSTEVSAFFNISPWLTYYELWHRKANNNYVTGIESERMKWGKRLEAVIGQGVADDNGWQVKHLDNCFLKHKDCDRMGSSFDFYITKSEFGEGIMEIKNVDLFRFKDIWEEPSEDNEEGKVPLYIEMQLQHQLEVANLNWGCIVALVGGNRVVIYKRQRNKKIGEAIFKKVTEFWQSIDNNVEPLPDFENDADYITSLYPHSEEDKIADMSENFQLIELLKRYDDLSNQEKVVQKSKAGCKAEILDLVKDHQKIICDDFRLTLNNIKPKEITYTRSGYRSFSFRKIKNNTTEE